MTPQLRADLEAWADELEASPWARTGNAHTAERIREILNAP